MQGSTNNTFEAIRLPRYFPLKNVILLMEKNGKHPIFPSYANDYHRIPSVSHSYKPGMERIVETG